MLIQVLAHLGRLLTEPPLKQQPHDDPVFLPDAATLTPDQAQELRYGKERDR